MPYRQLIDEVATEFRRFTSSSETASWFPGFEVIKNPPTRQPLAPPSIILSKLPAPGSEYGLGTHEMRTLNLHVDLVFKDGHLKTVSGSVLQRDDLATHYLERLQAFFTLIRLTSSDIGDIRFDGSIHSEPSDLRSEMLYGVQAETLIRFRG